MGLPNLPIDVLQALAPVLPAIRAEVHEAVVSVEAPRLARKGVAQVRASGGSYGYAAGHEAIMSKIFGLEGQNAWPEVHRSEFLDEDQDEDEDGCDCGECDCSTCYPDDAPYSCCGYCSRCDECHTDMGDSHYTRRLSGGGVYCRECDHECRT